MTSHSPIRYIIAEDHPILREAIVTVLSGQEDYVCVGKAANGGEALELVDREMPDALLLDLNMPVMNGLETLRRLQEKHPALPVIMLTMYQHPYILHSLVDAGACGVLQKEDTSVAEIAQALRAVRETGYYFNQHLTKAVLRSLASRNQQPRSGSSYARLEERETAILRYFCKGLSSEAISRKVFLCPRSVDRVRRTLLEKTGAQNLAGLIVFAVRAGLYR